MSFAREPGILDYQIFGWTSELNHISWKLLEIVHNSGRLGILTTLNGNMIYKLDVCNRKCANVQK